MRKLNLIWIFVLCLLFMPIVEGSNSLLISALDNYTQYAYEQTDISNFTAIISNGTHTYNETANISEFVVFTEVLGLWNITITHDDYNSVTYENYNVSDDLTAYMTQTHEHELIDYNNTLGLIVEDTRVYDSSPTTNYVNQNYLVIEKDYNPNDYADISYFNIDLTNYNNIGNLNNFVLNVNQYDADTSYEGYGYICSDANMSLLTWNNRDILVTNCSNSMGVIMGMAQGWYSDDLNGIIEMSDILTPFSVKYSPKSMYGEYQKFFRSINYATPSSRPYISANYTSNFTIEVFDSVDGSDLNNATINISHNDWNYVETLNATNIKVFGFDEGNYNISVTYEGTTETFDDYDLSSENNYLPVNINPHILYLNIHNFTSLDLMNQQVDITISNGDFEETINTSNGTINYRLDSGSYEIKLESDGFSTNYYYVDVYATTTLNAYLWQDSECSAVDFTIQNLQSTSIEDALLTFNKKINLSWVSVSQKYTDIVGMAQVCLDNEEYLLYVEKEGYETWSGEFSPTQSSYTIRIGEESSLDFMEAFAGVSYYYSPTNILLEDGTINFSLMVSSDYGNIREFGLYTNYGLVDYLENVTGSPAGGNAILPLDLNESLDDLFNITYFITTNNDEHLEFYAVYQVGDSGITNYSLMTLADELKEEEDSFTIGFIAYIFILIIMGLISVTGMPTLAVMGSGVILMGIAVYIGFLPLIMGGVSILLMIGLLVVFGLRGGRYE